VGALEYKFWQLLCETIDQRQWAERHWTRGEVPGSAQALQLKSALAEIFASQALAQWTQRFANVDCCVTPVLRLDEAQDHPLFQT
jgi:crotonobetainyl-CoA:carnitine CoA-transferase CaiB-like acyl-CoA transferase